MKRVRRCTRIFILSLLVVSVVLPIFFLSGELKHSTKEFIEDLSSIKIRTDSLKLNAIGEEVGESLKIPTLIVYKDVKVDPATVLSSSGENATLEDYGRNDDGDYFSKRNESNPDAKGDNQLSQPEEINSNISSSKTTPDAQEGKQQIQIEKLLSASGLKEDFNETAIQHDHMVQSQSRKVLDEKLKEMKDQLIRARAYLNFAQPDNNPHLIKELKIRIKELEHAMGGATKDSDLSKRAGSIVVL